MTTNTGAALEGARQTEGLPGGRQPAARVPGTACPPGVFPSGDGRRPPGGRSARAPRKGLKRKSRRPRRGRGIGAESPVSGAKRRKCAQNIKNICIYNIAVVLFLAAGLLGAQETMGNYFVRRSESGEQTIVQRLFWPGDENALRYEVVVEREDAGAFTGIYRESTENDYTDISLGPGNYRYQVRVFNLLNRFEYATNWASFRIILAVQPELALYAPEFLYIYESYRWELRLEGVNLAEDGEAYLVSLEDPSGALTIKPDAYIPRGEEAILVFDPGKLRPGAYRALVRNPGGLEASAGPVRIEAFRPSVIELSAGYGPLAPLYGYLFDTFDGFAPLGMELRGAFVFFKRPWGFLGLEGQVTVNYLSAASGNFEASAFIAGAAFGLLYKKPLPLRAVFNARLGGGVSAAPWRLVFDYGNYTSSPLSSWIPQAVLGLSLEWAFAASFYAELGADYVQLFSPDSPRPGFLRPFLAAGWNFFMSHKQARRKR